MQIRMALRQRGWSVRTRDFSHVSVSCIPSYFILRLQLRSRRSRPARLMACFSVHGAGTFWGHVDTDCNLEDQIP